MAIHQARFPELGTVNYEIAPLISNCGIGHVYFMYFNPEKDNKLHDLYRAFYQLAKYGTYRGTIAKKYKSNLDFSLPGFWTTPYGSKSKTPARGLFLFSGGVTNNGHVLNGYRATTVAFCKAMRLKSTDFATNPTHPDHCVQMFYLKTDYHNAIKGIYK